MLLNYRPAKIPLIGVFFINSHIEPTGYSFHNDVTSLVLPVFQHSALWMVFKNTKFGGGEPPFWGNLGLNFKI